MADLPAATGTSALSASACIRCAHRKVKCDRQRPCAACVRHHVDCVYTPYQPYRLRRKHARERAVSDGLRRYETLLRRQSSATADTRADPGAVNRLLGSTGTRVVHAFGRSQVVDKYVKSRW
jgi:hypothetical protein